MLHYEPVTPMRFVRSLLLLIYFFLYTVPYATACFIAFPFLRPDARYWMAAGWCKSTIVVLRHLIGIRYAIQGMENLPTAEQTKAWAEGRAMTTDQVVTFVLSA